LEEVMDGGGGSGRQPRVAPLHRRDFPRAGEVLGRAFAKDPLWSVLMSDTKLRGAMFTGAARMVAAGGGAVEATPGIEAVALWMSPGRKLGVGAFLKSGLAPLRWLVRTPWRELRRLMTFPMEIDEQREALISGPHWCLEVLGVDPDWQGRGLGSALVAAGLQRADRDNVPTYVDTTEKRNVDFYVRFGFEVRKEIAVTDLEAPFWMMIRPAAR
jgi:GNAT superfamily N-acetyltransferase